MQDIKTNFEGGLNLDDSYFALPPNSYVDALNITRNALAANKDKSATNVVGNRNVSFTLPSGINKTIGSYPFLLRGTVIYMVYNSNGYHGVLEYDHTARGVTKIFESKTDSAGIDVLNFTENDKITSIDIFPRDEGDLLYFLDSLGRPTQMDIKLFKAGEYTPVTRAILDKGKKPPLSPPQVVYDNDTTRRSNDLRNKLFRFKTRFIYDDFEKSTFSPISIVDLPVGILDDAASNLVTNNNVIRLSAYTGDRNVKSIELAVSYVDKTNDWSDFESVEVIEKASLRLSAKTDISVTGSISNGVILFSGIPIAGTVINVYLKSLPSLPVLIGSYTSAVNDTPTIIATAIAASMTSIGIVNTISSTGASVAFSFSNMAYIFDKVDILFSGDVDNINFAYSFYNDSTYPTVDVAESIQLFDYIPDKANAQALVNGNVLAYAGITEGYDKNTVSDDIITVGTVVAGNGGGVGSLSSIANAIDFRGLIAFCPATFTGIPATGTVINLKIRRRSDGVLITGGTYTTVAGDTSNTIVAKFTVTATDAYVNGHSGSQISIGLVRSTYQSLVGSNDWIKMEIIPPSTSLVSNSVATWKWSTQRNIGRAYFDEKGKTNGILYTDKVVFPAYDEDGSHIPLLPFINYKINDVPPDWAFSMQFYFTKENTKWLFWQTLSVNTAESEYIYFEVTSLLTNAIKKPTTATVLNYEFKDGDRLRVIRDVTTNVVLGDTYDSAIEGLVKDPSISGTVVVGTFVKIKKVAPFASGIVNTDNYVIEMYTPAQQDANAENQVYYELGRQYPIIDPTLSTRRHGGEVTNQTIGSVPAEYNFYQGDAYFRPRTIASTDTGYATFNVMDRNFVDFYISAVSSVDGRASVIDINARKQYYSTLIRFGQAYQANTNINGLNRFYALNFDEYDISFGDVVRLKVRDRYLKVFQIFKIGIVPLFGQITKDATGNSLFIPSDKLLNPIQYRIGNFGLSAPESLMSWHFADYGCDTNRGVIWRDSNDGVDAISRLYKVDSWAITELPKRKGNSKIYGAFDPITNEYIIALDAYESNPCIPVTVPEFEFEFAVVGVPYRKTITVYGSPSFTFLGITTPTWMLVSIIDGSITFYGTPTEVGVSEPVSFRVTNTCGDITTGKTIDVSATSCMASAFVGTPSLPNGTVGVPYSYAIELTGSTPFFLTDITAPAWMTIDIVGSTIIFSGTPDSTGALIVVSFVVNNCSETTTPFSGTLNVADRTIEVLGTISNSAKSVNVTLASSRACDVTFPLSGTYDDSGTPTTFYVNVTILAGQLSSVASPSIGLGVITCLQPTTSGSNDFVYTDSCSGVNYLYTLTISNPCP